MEASERLQALLRMATAVLQPCRAGWGVPPYNGPAACTRRITAAALEVLGERSDELVRSLALVGTLHAVHLGALRPVTRAGRAAGRPVLSAPLPRAAPAATAAAAA
eukprot:scaffold53728_cov51-Phaeocystis_antarctica.AAC.1